MVIAAVLLVDPTRQRRSLVVEEDAAVFHCRFTLNPASGFDIERVFVFNGYVGPPVPGRDANLLGEVVDAKDRAALVAARDDQGTRDAGQGMRNDLGERRFPLASNFTDVDFSFANQAVDDNALADGADQDYFAGRRLGVFAECRVRARDAVEVRLQVVRGADDAGPVTGVDPELGHCSRVGQGEAALRRRRLDDLGLAQS